MSKHIETTTVKLTVAVDDIKMWKETAKRKGLDPATATLAAELFCSWLEEQNEGYQAKTRQLGRDKDEKTGKFVPKK